MAHHPSLLAEILKRKELKDIPLTEAEQEVIGYPHSRMGAGIIAVWGFPDLLIGALKGLSAMPVPDSELESRLAAALYPANYLANDWTFDNGMEQNDGPIRQELFGRLGISPEELENWKPQLKETALYAGES